MLRNECRKYTRECNRDRTKTIRGNVQGNFLVNTEEKNLETPRGNTGELGVVSDILMTVHLQR